MNTIYLNEQLVTLGVNPNYYSIGKLRDNSLILIVESGTWKVFFFERGKRFDVKIFDCEKEACEHFLKVINSDSSFLDPTSTADDW